MRQGKETMHPLAEAPMKKKKNKKKKRKRAIVVQHEEEARAPPAYQAASDTSASSGPPAAPAKLPATSVANVSATELERAANKLFPGRTTVSCPENLAVVYPQAQRTLETTGGESRSPGINCCAVCAAPTEGPAGATGSTECKRCGKVAYCSPNCAAVDARVHARACRLLRLCELDQSFQEGCLPTQTPTDMAAVVVPPPPWVDGWDSLLGTELPRLQRWALTARLSHAFTLIDAVWHLGVLGACCVPLSVALASTSTKTQHNFGWCILCVAAGTRQKMLNRPGGARVYVIGASGVESDVACWDYCARCLAALAARENISAGTLTVCLVGPEVPEAHHRKTILLPLQEDDNMATEDRDECLRIKLYCHRGNFEGYHAFNYSRQPDAVFGFNLGLSVPDYSWGAGLAAVQDCANAIARNGGPALPIVCTASSRAEAVQELLLFEQHQILQIGKAQTKVIEEGEEGGSSARLLHAARRNTASKSGDRVGHDTEGSEEHQHTVFLEPNIYGWERVQQSGAMANDVYRKSCWLFGGRVTVGDGGGDALESEEDERPSRLEIYEARRHARQQRKNKRLKKRARVGH